MEVLQRTDGGSALDVPALPPEWRRESQTLLSDLHRLGVGSQSARGNTIFFIQRV